MPVMSDAQVSILTAIVVLGLSNIGLLVYYLGDLRATIRATIHDHERRLNDHHTRILRIEHCPVCRTANE